MHDEDAGICIAKVWATSRSLRTLIVIIIIFSFFFMPYGVKNRRAKKKS